MDSRPLTYASAAKPPWWRRHRRGILIATSIVVIAVGTARYGETLLSHPLTLVAQKRALAYTPPPDLRVYRWVETTGQEGEPPTGSGSRTSRSQWNSPVFWNEFVNKAELPWGPIVMLAERSAGREPRIVYIRVAQGAEFALSVEDVHSATLQFSLAVQVLKPGSLVSPPSVTGNPFPAFYDYSVHIKPGAPLSIYAGRPDPQDPAHFTIRCEAGTGNGSAGMQEMLDGRLMPDDTIQLTKRRLQD